MLIRCGGCKRKLEVEDKLAGELGACPACKSVIKMPTVDEVTHQKPGDPPLAARAIPKEELERMLPNAMVVVEDGGGSSGGSNGAANAEIETDEDGFVLAVPVEDDDEASLTEIPGQGVGIKPPSDEEDAGYALAGEDESLAASSSQAETGEDLSDGLDEILSELDQQRAEDSPDEKIVTRCPGCKGLLAIESQYAGKMRTCPKCATEIHVPLESDVAIPQAKEPSPDAEADAYSPPPSALAENLAGDVDIEDYVVGGSSGGSTGIAAHWVLAAFVVGVLVGFAAGWIVSGMRSQPGPPAVEPGLPAELQPAPTADTPPAQ